MITEHEQHAAQQVLNVLETMRTMSKERGFEVSEDQKSIMRIQYSGFTGRQDYEHYALAKMGLISAVTGTPMSVDFDKRHGVLQPKVDVDNLETIANIFRKLNKGLSTFVSEQDLLGPSHVVWRMPPTPGINATESERSAHAVLENIYESGAFRNRTFNRDAFIYLYLTDRFTYVVNTDADGSHERHVDVPEELLPQFSQSVLRIVELVAAG
ncbi:hypothetical protein pEaSNUABM52_00064 [Erwinia phage pEp_SNUABM_52]|nr:hypothetical protein pEaSNUABM52_00064 [Erwinia phage pEp_SNUABM_52]